MLNSVTLIGRLTRKPEVRYTGTGTAVASFSLAVERPFTNRNGEREADFIDVVTWRQLAEVCGQHLDKGRLVAIQGRLQIRAYESQDGQRRKAAEVVAQTVRFLDRRKRDEGAQAQAGGFGEQAGAEDAAGSFGAADDDDVPFG